MPTNEKTRQKYGHVPIKESETQPWKLLCVDLVGPYTATLKSGKECTLNAMTFIDPATGWFEISEIREKTSTELSQVLDSTWLSRYPRPESIIFDNGTEIIKDFKYIFEDYGIKPRRTTIKNSQDNSILERVHQVLGNILRCKNISNLDLEEDDPWTALLSSIAFP